MKFDMNRNRRSSEPAQPGPKAGQNASPAVPLSVYRELAAELQATQAMLDSLNAQNRQLRKSNQHMQLELDQIIESAQKMQQISTPAHQATQQQVAQELQGQPKVQKKQRGGRSKSQRQGRPIQPMSPEPPTQGSRPSAHPAAHPAAQAVSQPPLSDREAAVQTLNKMLTERDTSRTRPKLSGDRGELSTWWLMAMVLFIVITAFGTGFMLVRPFLNGSMNGGQPIQPVESDLLSP